MRRNDCFDGVLADSRNPSALGYFPSAGCGPGALAKKPEESRSVSASKDFFLPCVAYAVDWRPRDEVRVQPSELARRLCFCSESGVVVEQVMVGSGE